MSEKETNRKEDKDLHDDDLFDGDSHLSDRFRQETDFQPVDSPKDKNQFSAECFVEVCPEGAISVIAG